MKQIIYGVLIIFFLAMPMTGFGASGTAVTYTVDGKPYEGYFISPSEQAPFVLLIHDWDGLTD